MNGRWVIAGLVVQAFAACAIAGCGGSSLSNRAWSAADVHEMESRLSSEAPQLTGAIRECVMREVESKLSPDEVRKDDNHAKQVGKEIGEACARKATASSSSSTSSGGAASSASGEPSEQRIEEMRRNLDWCQIEPLAPNNAKVKEECGKEERGESAAGSTAAPTGSEKESAEDKKAIEEGKHYNPETGQFE